MPGIEELQISYNGNAENGPQISLVIPCYNSPEKELDRALNSVQKQTFRNYEIILVDDGSQEEYHAVLDRVCSKYCNIKRFRTENRGVSAARNTGILHATGKYLAFLDADDFLTEDFLERAFFVARETNADYVIGGVTVTDTPEHFRTPERTAVPKYELYHRKAFHPLYPKFIGLNERISFEGGYINRGMVARLVRTDLMREALLDETLRIGEDVVWNLQFLNHCETVCLVKESWYCYWRNPNSASHRYDPDFIGACEKQLERIADLIDKEDPGLYCAYVDRIYEHLRMSWNNFFYRERTQNRANFRSAAAHIYSSPPWTELGAKRSLRSAHGKKKLTLLLYKLHLYYAIKVLKEYL